MPAKSAAAKKVPDKKPQRKQPPLKGTPVRRKHNALLAIPHRTADILTDPASIKTWDDEELERGYRRASNGKFVGGPPLVVPRIVHDEMIRRKMLRAQDALRGGLSEAIETLREIMTDKEADPKARVSAAKIVIDRNLGNMPISVELEEPKWAKALTGGIVAVTVAGDDDIIEEDDTVDAELVEKAS